MKDEKIFLVIDFNNIDLNLTKYLLEQNGWVINYQNNKMTIYESDDDFELKEMMCEKEGKTFEEAFLLCLIEIKNYYIRVTNGN